MLYFLLKPFISLINDISKPLSNLNKGCDDSDTEVCNKAKNKARVIGSNITYQTVRDYSVFLFFYNFSYCVFTIFIIVFLVF